MGKKHKFRRRYNSSSSSSSSSSSDDGFPNPYKKHMKRQKKLIKKVHKRCKKRGIPAEVAAAELGLVVQHTPTGSNFILPGAPPAPFGGPNYPMGVQPPPPCPPGTVPYGQPHQPQPPPYGMYPGASQHQRHANPMQPPMHQHMPAYPTQPGGNIPNMPPIYPGNAPQYPSGGHPAQYPPGGQPPQYPQGAQPQFYNANAPPYVGAIPGLPSDIPYPKK